MASCLAEAILGVRDLPARGVEEGSTMNRFLIATDGSPAADAAVEAGVQLAAEQGAAVVFLRVVDTVDVVAPPFGPIVVHPIELGKPEDDEVLSDAGEAARKRGVPYELRLVSGLEVETILATADEIDAELIAIGSNRHGALGSVFFGSVSMGVLRQARRPILVIHPTPAPVAASV
jgi:nucleotide-binding universal stress UspA family protein